MKKRDDIFKQKSTHFIAIIDKVFTYKFYLLIITQIIKTQKKEILDLKRLTTKVFE